MSVGKLLAGSAKPYSARGLAFDLPDAPLAGSAPQRRPVTAFLRDHGMGDRRRHAGRGRHLVN